MPEAQLAELQEVKERSQELLDLPPLWHDRFAHEVWKKPSLHNRSHVEAVEEANETYLMTAEYRDPLDLKGNLLRWNERHPNQPPVSFEELKLALNWAIRCHDLGNIMGSLGKSETGELTPIFLDTYRAKQAEERSRRLAQTLLEESDLPQDRKQKLIPLIRHLIGETVYQPKDRTTPFALYMRVMDQIGNDLFSRNEERVYGLLEEMKGEKPDANFIPYNFMNFVRERLPQLIPNRKKWKELLRIWKKPLPPEKAEFSKEPMPISDYLTIKGR